MKRNTLYTIDKYNGPAIVNRLNRNIYDGFDTSLLNTASSAGAANIVGSIIGSMGNKTPDFSSLASAASGAASSGGGGIAGALRGLVGGGGGGIGGALKGAVGAMGGISGIGSAVGGAIGNLIGGGYSSGVGNALGAVGKMASVIPGPWGAAISGGLQVLGGGVNALFGSKVDAVRLGEANKEMSALNSFKSNATSFDDIKGATATKSVADIYKGGVFNKSAAKDQAALEERMAAARQFADRSIGNNIYNLADDQTNQALANYSAFGGPLGDSFGGALGLMQQNRYIDAINNRSNAITKGLEAVAQQQPTTFTNRFDDGGFVNNFMQDPIAAAMNYIKQRDAEEAQAEAQAAQEAREQEFNNLQTRLMNAETQNQGLQALLEDQGRSIASLQEAQNAALFTPSAAASDSNPDNWKTSAIATAREVAGDDNYSSLKNFIKGQEGFRSKAYWLKGEKAPTIGYGFHMVYPGTNRPVKMGDTITQEEAEQGLTTVLRGIDRDLSKKVPNWDKLTSYQRDALRDLAYGTGTGGAHFRKNSKLMTALRNEDWEEAERNLVSRSIKNPQYNKALLRRSRQRQDMFREGKYAFGGELGTNGTDFTNGLLQVNAGNTHERNPFGGVPMGLDQQGIPNLVEEGETVFNDYVFSKRLKVPNFMLKDLGLGGAIHKGKRHRMSFADVSKKLAEESEKRPNDPISMNGLNASLSKLMEIQEAERMKEQAKQQSEEIDMASDDLDLMAACGGKLNKYDYGGALNYIKGENVGNKQQIAKAMDAYINKYMKSSKAKDDVKYRNAYSAVMNGMGNFRTPTSFRDEGTSKKHYQELLNLGMDKRVAFGLAFPQVQKISDPYSPFGYDVQTYNNATSRRNTLYNELVRGSKSSESQSRANTPSNSTTWGTSKSGLHTRTINGKTQYRGADGRYYNSEQRALGTRTTQTPRAAAQTPQQAAPTSSSTPSTAASNTGSARSTARRSAAPATTRTAQSNIPAQSNFEAFREYRRNNPFEDTASQNDLVAAAQAMASANGMPLEVEGAAPGTNTNPSNRRWNVGNYDWLSGDFNPSNTAGFIPYNRNMSADDIAREENSDRYKAWTDYVLNNWDNRDNTDVQNYLRELDTRAGGNHLFDANGNLREDARDYFQYARGVGNNSNHAWGYYHLTPTWADEVAEAGSDLATTSGNAPFDWSFTPYGSLRSEEIPVPGNGQTTLPQAGASTNTADDAASLRATNSVETDLSRQSRGTGRIPQYDTRMRYAPVIGAGLMSLTDALGLTNKPDYSGVSALEAAANRAAYAPNVKAPYIGDYMRYTPFDRLFYANQLQANSRATDRALMNTSAGNRGTAQAAMLANAYNTNNNLGNLYRQAEEYNRAQYERTKEFNRRTNMFNAQMGLEADMANARYTQQASQMGLHGLAQAAAMRNDIDARTGAAKTANLSNLFTSLGNIGRENMAFNMINSTNAARNGYWIDNKGVVHYVGKGDGLV